MCNDCIQFLKGGCTKSFKLYYTGVFKYLLCWKMCLYNKISAVLKIKSNTSLYQIFTWNLLKPNRRRQDSMLYCWLVLNKIEILIGIGITSVFFAVL